MDIPALYETRFNKFERIRKEKLWKVLCREFLQQFIGSNDCVLDVGAGSCEFINNIKAGEKWAFDGNPDLKKYAGSKVKTVVGSVKRILKFFPKKKFDVIFMSNLLEHLDNKEEVFRLLLEAYKILDKGGRLLVMQPDIKLVGNSYWDFFDHKVAITFASLTEVLLSIGFKIEYSKYPFMPYSTKVKLIPLNESLLKFYIKFWPLHYLFGKQFFVIAKKV